jgi:hypothetical protein
VNKNYLTYLKYLDHLLKHNKCTGIVGIFLLYRVKKETYDCYKEKKYKSI